MPLKLDYNEATGAYWLTVPRSNISGETTIQTLMEDHGLDFSTSASTAEQAVLFTREPYAAVTFFEFATARAQNSLASLHAMIESSRAPSSDRHIAVPADKELWAFQKANIDYAFNRQHILVGDQPGLGKTPTAIALANEMQAKRVLVVVPASIRMQWVRKIREWTTLPWPYTIHPIFTGRNGVHPRAEWTVVSYELARNEQIYTALMKGSYDLLILDEAHYLKTIDSLRTRSVFGGGEAKLLGLAERSAVVCALTGTPLPNRPREAYTLARGLCFDAIDWQSEARFRKRYNPSRRIEIETEEGETKFFVDERTGRHSELQNRMRANFMTRHLKKDVMPQLQMPIFDIIQIEADQAIKQALKAESLLNLDPDGFDFSIPIDGEVATVRRMMGVAMSPHIADYVSMLIDGGETKIVLFGWHHEVLDIWQEKLARHGIVRIDGGTSTAQREFRKNQFMYDPKIEIIVGNLSSLGLGTDGLQHVSCHALIGEPDWTPGVNIQAFDRLDRGGQTRQVQGDIFVAVGSIVERIMSRALNKLQTTHKALDKRFEI